MNELTFATALGPMQIKAKFNLGKMTSRGKTALPGNPSRFGTRITVGCVILRSLMLAGSAQPLPPELVQLRAAEEELRHSRQALDRYRYLFENCPVPAWVYELATLNFLAVNKAACNKYGYSEDEFLGLDLRGIRPEEEVPALLENVATRSEEHQQSGPWKHRTRDRRIILVEISSHEMTYEGRKARFVIANDVTEREQAKNALQERERQLMRANARLARSNADLEDFAHTVSHDLQEPLRAVSSYAELLARKFRDSDDEDTREFVGYIADGGRRMHAMIESLLLYSRVLHHGVSSEPVDLNDAVEWACGNLERAIEESNGRIIREPLPVVMGNEFHMGQLFQNLIANALRYRGKVPPVVRIAAVRCGTSWRIEVSDNGIGIPKEHHESVFRIFKRLHQSSDQGSGVGLALCKKIAERYGGEIWVESEPGQGSRFCISFPA
jgi:PAS domain S-box-containing protein